MSTKIWTNPNDPNPADPTRYKIGYEGLEHQYRYTGIQVYRYKVIGFAEDILGAVYRILPSYVGIGVAGLYGLLDWNWESAIPKGNGVRS